MAYEFDGKRYEQASSHQKEWGRRLIDELDLSGTERVLDLGCGDGVLTAQLASLVPGGSVTGIDASSDMIETAREKSAPNLRFLVMDIEDVDFSGEFDIVFSNAALHWVKHHDRLLRNVRRALTYGGRARFNFAGDGNCPTLLDVFHEVMALDPFAPFFDGFEWPWYMPTVDAYQALAETAGFTEVQVWGEQEDRRFPDADSMVRWIDQPSLVPLLPQVPADRRRAFRNQVITRMIERTRQPDGSFLEEFRRINLLAKLK